MTNKPKFKTAAVVALVGLAVPFVSTVANSDSHEADERFFESQYRHDVMEHFNYSMKKLVPILFKNTGPREHIPAIANIMASTATMSKAAFEKDTRDLEGHTEAKDDVWENWSDFASRMDALERDTAAFAEVANRTDDPDEVMAAFRNVGRNCKGCHDVYKND